MEERNKQEAFSAAAFASVPAAFALLIGLGVICGWLLNIAFLRNPFPGESPVAFSTALACVLSAASFLAPAGGRKWMRVSASFLSALIAFTILCHYLFGTFDLDSLIYGRRLEPFDHGRMSPTILFVFLAVNAASLLDSRRFRVQIEILALFAGILCITAFATHFFDLPHLMRISSLIQMSSPAAIAGSFLSWSLIFNYPDFGIAKIFAADTMGGRFARQYLLPSILLPFLLANLTLTVERCGVGDTRFGIALVSLLLVCFLVSMVWKVSHWLDEADRQKKTAREDVRSNIEATRLIVDSTMDAFMMMDTKGKVVYWNPAAEKMMGWTLDEVVGREFEFVLAPEERQMHVQNVKEYDSTGHTENINKLVELSMQRKDGTVFPVECRPFAVKSQGRELLCSFLQDISSRKESERRINEFVSTVSHELRTPLTSIKGALRLIEGGVAGEISEDALSLVNVATSETERLIRLVNDILDLKKIESGKLELKFEQVEIKDLIDRALDGISGMSSEYGIRLQRHQIFEGQVSCDRDRIIQVLVNLLSNAIKFSPEGETVSLSLENREPGFVRFCVSDNGCGIPESQVHKLFGRFQQLDSSDSRQQGGTGLGLSISKAIIEQHEGSIGFESCFGQGSLFWFELPLLLSFTAEPLPCRLETEGLSKQAVKSS